MSCLLRPDINNVLSRGAWALGGSKRLHTLCRRDLGCERIEQLLNGMLQRWLLLRPPFDFAVVVPLGHSGDFFPRTYIMTSSLHGNPIAVLAKDFSYIFLPSG